MHLETRKLLTITTEAALEQSVLEDLERLGAHGYTITDARGRGQRGSRTANWDLTSNIRIEVVCGEQVAEAIVAHIREHYYANYAMIVFLSDVEVLRPEKF